MPAKSYNSTGLPKPFKLNISALAHALIERLIADFTRSKAIFYLMPLEALCNNMSLEINKTNPWITAIHIKKHLHLHRCVFLFPETIYQKLSELVSTL